MAKAPRARETLKALKELQTLFQKQAPSAPDWYQVIDHIVGNLLAFEIERREKK